MKYLAGSFLTIIAIFVYSKFIFKNVSQIAKSDYRYSQSHIHHLINPLLPPLEKIKKGKITQSQKHYDKVNLKVVILNDDAYWIKDNVLYTGKITQDGIDKDTSFVVDTMAMDKVQLDQMLFIVDQLREGKIDDSRDSGNK